MKRRIRHIVKRISVSVLVYAPALTDVRSRLMSLYRRIFRRPLDPSFLALKLLGVSNKRVLLDIGGAMGESVAALRLYARSAPIISFEPNPFFAAAMQRRYRSDMHVDIQQFAVGKVDGEFPLYVPVYRYTTFPELATFVKDEAANWLPTRIIGFDPTLQTVLELRCLSRALDSLDLDPEVVKIDTRCDASAIIEGAVRTIGQSRPIILLYCAVLSPKCMSLLADCDYSVLSLHEKAFAATSNGEFCDLAVHRSVLDRLILPVNAVR